MNQQPYIKITKDGPYLVFGECKLSEKVIVTDEQGVCIKYACNKIFEIKSSPYALCRCGKTKTPPFCDASHTSGFDGKESASFEPVLNCAQKYEGANLTLMDNEKLCAYARFCDANGSIWNLIYQGDEFSDSEVVREANMCPAGRLMVFDKEGRQIEHPLECEISVLEDDGLKISGPLWVQGGIKVQSENGECYEVRNRQTLCRCGKSKNKPFCDSTHMHIKFKANES